MANIDELRLARDIAERAHQDCLRRIRSSEAILEKTDPRNEADYDDLLNRLHTLEDEERKLWFSAMQAKAAFSAADDAQRYGRGVQ